MTAQPSTRRSSRSRLASVVGGAPTLVLRRAWRDRALVSAQVVLVAAAAALSVAAPHLVLGTVDDGLRDSLRRDPVRTTTTVQLDVGGADVAQREGALGLADSIAATAVADHLPPALRDVLIERGTVVQAPTMTVTQARRHDDPDRTPVQWLGPRALTLASYVLDPAPPVTGTVDDILPGAMRLVDGRAPVDPAYSFNSETGRRIDALPEIEILIADSVSESLGLPVGTAFRVAALGSRPVELHVVGTFEATDPASPSWDLVPEALTPFINDAREAGLQWYGRGAAFTTLGNMERLNLRMGAPFPAVSTFAVDTDHITVAQAEEAAVALRGLRADPSSLLPDVEVPVLVTTELVEVLDEFPARARVALAQISVLLAGVIGVAAAAVGLMAHLLDRRRAPGLALERARGASLPAVSVRLLGEQLLLTVLGVGAGVAAAVASGAQVGGTEILLGAVTVVALLAAPVLGFLTARASWRSTRSPANRSDRAAITRRRTTTRWVLRVAIVALAAAAVASLRSRGLLAASSTGVDPFLAGTAVLLALAAAVVVAVLVPGPLRLVARLGRRTRGVLGPLAAAQVGRSVRLLPLTALTLGIATAVSGLLVSDTIERGQVDASWYRVGAEVRIDAPLTPDQVSQLASAPGVDAAGAGTLRPYTNLLTATHTQQLTLVTLDKGSIEALVAAQPYAAGALDVLLESGATGADGTPIPLVLDPTAARLLAGAETGAIRIGQATIPVVPVSDDERWLTLAGWTGGPVAYVDRAAFETALGEPLPLTHAWAAGAGARAAAEGLDVPADAVLSRGEWLEQMAASPLVGGVLLTIQISVVAVAVLTLVALVSTVLAGARDRGQVLSTLRTLGLPARFGWQLALLELVPLVLCALLGGIAAALVSLLWLGPVLGLEVLTAGFTTPTLVVSPEAVLGITGGVLVLLLLAVLTEVLAHRRDRLSEVLRVGDAA